MLKSVAGVRVPFTPKQFPIRLSKRVGLRTMESVGGKKPVAVAVERIVNGGFETGDLTGWTASEYAEVIPDADFTPGVPHSGAYCCRIYSDWDTFQGWIRQTFAGAAQNKIVSFGFWHLGVGEDQLGRATIEYSDGTNTVVNPGTAPGYAWVYVNLLPYVVSGKTVTGIRISHNGHLTPYYDVDDVSLMVLE